jgi:hypothetical protein
MIQYKHKDYLMEIEPLENGNCEYLVNVHDFGNLESLVNRTLSYNELNYWIANIERYISENKYNY